MSAAPTTRLATEAMSMEPPGDARPRLDSVDLLRGAVMALMVLDHAREFFTIDRFDPTDLTRADAATFLTRWVTHFCAPTFAFLAGTGAYLASSRGRSRPALARFLLTRGLWLVVLELTVVRLGLTFNLNYQFVPLTVLWSIGVSMVVLSGLVFLPLPAIAAFGLVLIAGHNALDGVRPEDLGRFGGLWAVLHRPGPLATFGRVNVFVLYPLVPWIGVVAAGYAFGGLLRQGPQRRRRTLLALGLGLTAAFVVLRALNVYGDPRPWSAQKTPLLTALSFLNCQKYPPSLLFLLMTLGPAIAALAVFDREVGGWARPLVTLGRVPLFFYLLQWFLLHTLAIVVAWLRGQPYAWLIGNGPFGGPPEYGYGLPTVYLFWAVALVLLYPPCRRFAALKRRRRDPWLSYL
jgi:uncharacterized membrane protein